MKRLNFLFTLVIILVLASCTSTDEKLRDMIPDDALGVVKIDMPSLLKKSGIMNGEGKDATLSVPKDLKDVIDKSNENLRDDMNVLGDVINNLPESGIDVKSNCYVFLAKGPFQAVALLPLDDDEKAKEMVGKIVGVKMAEKLGVMFVSKLDYAFAIDDDVLLIARKNNVADDEASALAKDILDKSHSSLLEKEDIAKAIDVEDRDITAYILAEGLPVLLGSSKMSLSFNDISMMDIFAESGIKAMTATINFNDSKKGDERVDIVTDFICNDSGTYSILYDKVIASAAKADGASAIENVPGDLGTYFAIKVNGEELVKLPGVSKLLESIPMQGLDYGSIVSSINGAVVCGLKQDGDSYNIGVAVQSSSPDKVVSEIVNYAKLHGQDPSFNANGEYHYDTSDGIRALVLNNTDDAVYMRCVNYVPDVFASKWPEFVKTVKTSALAVFKPIFLEDKQEGNLCWGLHSKTHGEGVYHTEEPGKNIVISALKLMCWVEPSITYGDDDEEIGLSDY